MKIFKIFFFRSMFSIQFLTKTSMFNALTQATKVSLLQTRGVSVMARLTPPVDSKNRVKRVGRGPGSGLGKTSGRGQKGQKARGSVPNWFEGGQTPIWKLFPKRGFYRHQQLDLNEINLTRIQEFADAGRLQLQEGETLTMKKMKELGIITGSMKDGVAILGDGRTQYNLKIKIEATKITKSAVEAIESVGGKAVSAYYSRGLGFRAHHSPNWFLENKGYIPLRANPIARRDIQFYSDAERNGYLSDSEYVKSITVGGQRSKVVVKKSQLDLEVESAVLSEEAAVPHRSFTNNKIISFKDFKA